ncbi:MAG: glycosyltransferase family 9 protein [SAR324 cluster bacterium]|nr:glycosyltransferase family 9 protein [SAR324 cluster bacterium]
MNQSFSKILIIRFSSLGDIVLTTPVFREVKRIYPHSHITLLTSTDFSNVIMNNPYIDAVIEHPRRESWQELHQLTRYLKKKSFDLIYDIHCSLRSRFIRWQLQNFFSKKNQQIWKINKQEFKKILLIRRGINLLKGGISQRGMFLSPLQQQTPIALNLTTELFPSAEDKEKIEMLLQTLNLPTKHFICIGPSASFHGKCWPIEFYQNLIELLLNQNWPIVLVGSKSEVEPVQLKNYFGDKVHNLAGKLNPLESATLLHHAFLAVCNDTSIGHLAEAMGTPVITIFGPTVREFGYAPFLKQSILVENDLSCRPCTRNGKGECKINQKRLCLTSISPQMVYDHILQVAEKA